MLVKIKNNLNKIIILLSCVSLFFILTYVISLINQDMTTRNILSLVIYGLTISTLIVFLLMGYKNDFSNIKLISIVFVLFYSTYVIDYFYNILVNNTFKDIIILILYIAFIVLYFMCLSNNKFNFYFLILYVIVFSIDFLRVLGSGIWYSYSCVIINIIFGLLLFLKLEEKNNEKE